MCEDARNDRRGIQATAPPKPDRKPFQTAAPDLHDSSVIAICQVTLDRCQAEPYISLVIVSFKHKGLKELFEIGRSRRIAPDLQRRIAVRLGALDAARSLAELEQPGFDFHALHGKPRRYTIHVNGPWCLTFEWEDGNVLRIDLEQYH